MLMTEHFENEATGDDLAARLERAEAALRERKIDLQLMVDSIPAQVAVMNPAGEVEALNQPCLDYFGRTLDELKEWANSDPVHPEDLPRVIEVRNKALAAGTTYEVEARHRRHDGVYRWFDVRGFPLKDADSRILRWCVLLTDIDDRKQAEAALQASERNLREITDAIPTVIHVLRPDGSVLYVNQPVTDYTGLTMEEVLRPDYRTRVFHPEDLQRINEERRDALSRPEMFENEQRALGKDGKYRWFWARYQPLLNDRGQIDRWYVASVDIEDRKEAEAMLAGEKRLLEMIAGGKPLSLVLEALCQFVETTASDCQCGIYLIDWTGPTFHLGAAPSLPATFNDPLEGLPVTVAAGPCGEAALNGTQVIAEDFASSPEWQECQIRPLALQHGFRAQWSTPICSRDGQVLGTFAVFQPQPAQPTQLQLDLITQVTHIASIAIERALNDEALTRGERELKQIVDTIPALVWSSRPDGTAEFFNQHYLDYLGLSMDDAAGGGWIEAIHPDDRAGLLETWRRVFASEQSGEAEARLRRRDGEYRWFLYRANPVRDESGKVVKWYGINVDITERRLALERLQSNQDLLDLAQKSAGAMAFDWYIQEDSNYWSPEQEALFGLPPGGFDGSYKSWKKMMYANDWPTVVAAIQHAHETGQVTAEYRVVWPDGSLHWLSTNGRMFFDETGEPLRMVGFTSDVTKRKLIEEELRRSEAFLAEAQHLSSTGSFSWRVATDRITWSEELYRIYELELGVPVTIELIRTRVHPEDITLYEKMMERVRSGGGNFEYQYRLLMPDRRVKYLQAVVRETRDGAGDLEYIAAVQDITERRRSEETLEQVRSELAHMSRVTSLGALTASIAHEVNQPLSGIVMNASTCIRMLDADPPNLKGARETTQRTIRDGHRAADVIARLRALFAKKELTFESVDLNEAAREVIALSLSELQKNRVVLQSQQAEKLPLVAGDRVQLQQVILNLVRNAIDAMSAVDDRPRQLLIKTEPDEDGMVRLTVRDSGVGFDPQAQKSMFEAFYTTKSDGMGIGLSVSRSIIENHHGRIWATVNDGPGTAFSFSIPQAPPTDTKA